MPAGIPVARVVAVIAETESGHTQVGSGYLLDATRVLTARHCTIDSKTKRAAVSLKVVRASDGAAAAAVVGEAAPDLDVALLDVASPPWGAELSDGPVTFGRVDRDRSLELYGFEAEGFPRWQASDIGGYRDIAEVHGLIRVTEGRERQRLVLRDPVLAGVTTADDGPEWAGFSGAAVFHGGLLLGVVIEQHVLENDTTLHIRPIEAIGKADGDAERRLADALGISEDGALRPVAGPGRWWIETAGEPALAQWGWSLADDEEGVRHWKPRARGVSIDSEDGWRFRGRTDALNRIVSWLDRPRPNGHVLVVTGAPGAGKSAVLGRVVTTADTAVRTALPPDDEGVKATPGSVHCAVHARDKTALDVAREIARAASVIEPARPRDLAPAVRGVLHGSGNRFNVVIDALDEAASQAQVREIITDVVRPLAETCSNAGVQVLVGTRRRDDGGDLLARFPALDLLDLDDPEYFASEDLAAYALASLKLLGDERDGNPYEDDWAAVPLATRIAQVSGRNFLVAGLLAYSHGLRDEVAADPSQLDTPETVRSALDGYLERLPGVRGLPARRLLTALAFAEEPGLTTGLWKLAIEALPPRSVDEDWPVHVHTEQLKAFARSSAANFLVESRSESGPDGHRGRSYRLFHQALGEALLAAREEEEEEIVDRIEAEVALTNTFLETGRASGWGRAPAYLLRSLPVHAARAGLVDELLTDDAFLLHADLRRLLQAADGTLIPAERNRIRLLRLTPQALDASPADRVAMFSVTEALENLGDAYRDDCWQAPYRAVWAATVSRQEQVTCQGHQGEVYAVCAVKVEGRALLVTGSDDETVRLWDPGTGEQVRVLEGHREAVRAVCVVEMNGQDLLALGGYDGTVWLSDPRTGEQVQVMEGHQGWVSAMCTVGVDGQDLLATASRRDCTVRLWDPRTGEQVRALEGHQGEVNAVCTVEVGGRDLLATGSDDRTVRLWDPRTGDQIRALEGHRGGVNAVCTVQIRGRNLIATGSEYYGKGNYSHTDPVRLWDPCTGDQIRVFEGHRGAVQEVCTVEVGGRVLLATGGTDRTVRLWDPYTGEQIRVLEGHQGWVLALSAVEVDGRSLLAIGIDETMQLWNLADIKQSDAYVGHQGSVLEVCVVEVDGQLLLVSAGFDGTVRLWDPGTGEQARVLERRQGAVRAVSAVEVAGRVLVATYGDGGSTSRLLDPRTGEQVRALEGIKIRYSVGVMCAVEVNGQDLLAIGCEETVGLLDPRTGEQVRELEWYGFSPAAMCVVEVDGQDLLVVSSDSDATDRGWTVRLWDPRTGEQVRALEGEPIRVLSMCTVGVDGQELLAGGIDDCSVRLWDPRTGEQVRALEGHQGEVNAVCTVEVGGRDLLATGSDDRTVRLWDPRTGICLAIAPTHHQTQCMTSISGSLAIGLDRGILMIRPEVTG